MTDWLTASDVLTDLDDARWNGWLDTHARRLVEMGEAPVDREAVAIPAAPDTPQARRIILAGICSGMTLKAASEAVGWSKSLAGVRAQRDPMFRQQIDAAVRVRESNYRRNKVLS